MQLVTTGAGISRGEYLVFTFGLKGYKLFSGAVWSRRWSPSFLQESTFPWVSKMTWLTNYRPTFVGLTGSDVRKEHKLFSSFRLRAVPHFPQLSIDCLYAFHSITAAASLSIKAQAEAINREVYCFVSVLWQDLATLSENLSFCHWPMRSCGSGAESTHLFTHQTPQLSEYIGVMTCAYLWELYIRIKFCESYRR